VREALAKLRAEGLVREEPRRGSFVAELTPDDVREVYELRAALEAQAARLILRRDDDEALGELERTVDGLRRAAAADDPEEFARLDLGFHAELTRLSGNRRLHEVFVHQAGVLRTLLRLEVTTQYESLDELLAEHEQLMAEIASKDVRRAETACELHLEQALERVLRMLQAQSARAAQYQ
jgi:DNA-binding GntR family transcriptional regulator